MDRLKLSRIDEELDSSEVTALRFLCRHVITRKHLEKVQDAKDLFLKLEENGLLQNGAFLSQLLNTIRRADLLNLLKTDSRRPEETDANPSLSAYSVMLYNVHQNMTDENFKKIKFLMSGKLDQRQIDSCKTPLDVFAEMERTGLLSDQNLDVLHSVVKEFNQQLATTVKRHMQGLTQPAVPPHSSMDYQSSSDPPHLIQASFSVSETHPGYEGERVYTDANPETGSSLLDETEYYALTHNPRGLCVVINNERFEGSLGPRVGSDKDEVALRDLFFKFGFTVVVHRNLTADDMQRQVTRLSQRNFLEEDALVICVLSHGEMGSVYGSDGQKVYIRKLTLPFTSENAPTLAGKPKLFFIQACQGKDYQRGAVPLPPRPRQEDGDRQSRLEEDAGRVSEETVPSDADFLLGMATVHGHKSFRNICSGSIYIQELCKQLKKSAESGQSELGLKQLEVGGETVEVFGVERTVHSADDGPTTWQSYFLGDGHLASRVQVGSPVTMRLLQLPSQLQKGFEKIPLVWEEDMQMCSKFLDRKEELKANHSSYLRQHPEIRALISDFLQFLLLRKPDDVVQFAREYFLPFASGPSPEASLKPL